MIYVYGNPLLKWLKEYNAMRQFFSFQSSALTKGEHQKNRVLEGFKTYLNVQTILIFSLPQNIVFTM